ncbi:hypothetical protein ACWHY4_10120 [Pseudomonas sp. E2-15]
MKLLADEVYVISGNLLSATPSLTDPAVLEDIASSNLLCQLAADKNQGTRFIDPAAWLDFYRNSLGKLFWRVRNSGTVSYAIPQLVYKITVKEVLEKTFYKILERPQRIRVEESIELLSEQSVDSPSSKLYSLKTHVNFNETISSPGLLPHAVSSVNLQLSVVHGEALISVCSVYFKTSTRVGDDVFNQKFPVKELLGNISVSTFEAKLLESSYAGIRQSIIDKLGESNIRENILLVPAVPPSLLNLRHLGARQFVQELDI